MANQVNYQSYYPMTCGNEEFQQESWEEEYTADISIVQYGFLSKTVDHINRYEFGGNIYIYFKEDKVHMYGKKALWLMAGMYDGAMSKNYDLDKPFQDCINGKRSRKVIKEGMEKICKDLIKFNSPAFKQQNLDRSLTDRGYRLTVVKKHNYAVFRPEIVAMIANILKPAVSSHPHSAKPNAQDVIYVNSEHWNYTKGIAQFLVTYYIGGVRPPSIDQNFSKKRRFDHRH